MGRSYLILLVYANNLALFLRLPSAKTKLYNTHKFLKTRIKNRKVMRLKPKATRTAKHSARISVRIYRKNSKFWKKSITFELFAV